MLSRSRLLSIMLAAWAAFTFSFTACSGEDGADGVAGKDAEEVNVDSLAKAIRTKVTKDTKKVDVDSLADAIRSEVTKTLWDSLYAEPYVDTIYNILFDNTYSEDWMDSIREALVDSLKDADYDSLYKVLYDSIYNDIYTQHAIRTLDAAVLISKDDIYGAFANQYSLMYKDFKGSKGEPLPVPVGITVRNTCEKKSSVPCRWKKITLKSWIEGATDTSMSTEFVNPDTSVTLGASLKFDKDYLLNLTAPKQEQIQLRAYALENDREILFFSESKPTTVHPMQINGGEYKGVENRNWWYGVWVTPNMDSISTILDEVAKKLPGGMLKVYQKYSDDETIAESSARVVEAVFDVLKKRNIKYVENDGAGSVGQKINYPIEILRSKHAVCNEFSLLFASVLEAIGFQAALIVIPDHMFVGWYSERDGKYLDVVETTLLNNKDATFQSANEAAIETFTEEVTAEAQKSGDAEIILLDEVRKFGIMPNDIP